MTLSDVGNAALLALAGAGFAQALCWLLQIHRHRWVLHSHAITQHGVIMTTYVVTACLHCERCGARRLLERGSLGAPQRTWLYTRAQALVWLRTQCRDQVPGHLPESIEAPQVRRGSGT